jgi:hypothetical protein
MSLAACEDMNWLTVLWIVALIAALAAITGIKPSGTRPVARTGLMSAARVVLGLIALVIAYFAYNAR